MSNELNNIIARNSDGVYEGVAIGGDRYPGTRFIDHLLRYQDNPTVSVRKLTRVRRAITAQTKNKILDAKVGFGWCVALEGNAKCMCTFFCCFPRPMISVL